MIHVDEQPAPPNFDADVKQKGLKYFKDHGIDPNQPLPPKTIIAPLWRSCLDDMYRLYGGVCGYLAVHFERVTGAGSVDHFIAKSPEPSKAYEWENYRLACSRMNSCKREYDDVLDPFHLPDGWFHLELISGRIYPNPTLLQADIDQVVATISRLGLDEPGCREMRARHYEDYTKDEYTSDFLKKRSPFVWMEANRQGLL